MADSIPRWAAVSLCTRGLGGWDFPGRLGMPVSQIYNHRIGYE